MPGAPWRQLGCGCRQALIHGDIATAQRDAWFTIVRCATHRRGETMRCTCPDPHLPEHAPPCQLYTAARCSRYTIPLRVLEAHDGTRCTNLQACTARVERGPGWLLNATGITPIGYCTCDASGLPPAEHTEGCPIAALTEPEPEPEQPPEHTPIKHTHAVGYEHGITFVLEHWGTLTPYQHVAIRQATDALYAALTDPGVRARIAYLGPHDTVERAQATEVLNDTIDREVRKRLLLGGGRGWGLYTA